MATNRYSLADHIVVITLPDDNQEVLERSGLKANAPITIGGPGQNGNEGSFVGSIKVSRKEDLWDTQGDPTGSWVHNKSLNRTGNVDIDINQISDDVIRLSMICNAYEAIQGAVGGLTIEVINAFNLDLPSIAVCSDCLITKIPDQNLGEKAEEQGWSFTCGRVMFYS